MPGYVIHLCVAKEYLRNHRVKDEKEFFKGILAPDLISNEENPKTKTHYQDEKGNVNINLKNFLKQNKLNTCYMQGYFLHLVTDYLFYTKYFANHDSRLYEDYDKTNKTLIEKYEIEIPEEIKDVVKFKKGTPEIINIEKLNEMINEISKKSIYEYSRDAKQNEKVTTDLNENKLIEINKKNKTEKIFVGCIITILCLMMVFFINQKRGYYWDEIFSYGSSNNEFNNMYWSYNEFDGINSLTKEEVFNTKNPIKIIKNIKYYFIDHAKEKEEYTQNVLSNTNKVRWRTKEEADNYVKANNNRFNYYSVYYNQAQDVHPPLFYMLVHTVSSIFNNSFSKYFILLVNMPFFIGTCILIWKILNLIRKKNNSNTRTYVIWTKYRCNFNSYIL